MKIYLIPNVLAENTTLDYLPSIVKQTIVRIRFFFVEDVKNARRYLSRWQLGISLSEVTFFSLNKETSIEEIRQTWQTLPKDSEIGILSEAGCPGIADPGAVAVKLAHQLGYQVIPIPGPSSVFLALMASGLNGQSFAFVGYLPIEKKERQRAIRQLEADSLKKQQTQIFIETPYRNNALLSDVCAYCADTTLLCIASRITSPEEFIRTQSVGSWKQQLPDLHKKETVFLLLAQ
ncbi:MAG: SAM-dependent methyltransferase [Flammeovirgaceae bacterium]|nr:SAM-dependent methyltransferase [Flammeovirgaceae bacterium]MDW8286437.1 SAM-dependent methyltransferase [Flammeovirgaceae bacterium]